MFHRTKEGLEVAIQNYLCELPTYQLEIGLGGEVYDALRTAGSTTRQIAQEKVNGEGRPVEEIVPAAQEQQHESQQEEQTVVGARLNGCSVWYGGKFMSLQLGATLLVAAVGAWMCFRA